MSKLSVVTIPQLGVNDDRVKLVSWLVEEGDVCAVGQPICELETTKSVMEIEADFSGYIVPVVNVDEEANVSEPLALIGQDLEVLRSKRDELRQQQDESSADDSPAITMKARRLAEELGVDLQSLALAHQGDVIREADVRAAEQKSLADKVEIPVAGFKAQSGKQAVAIYGAGAGGVTVKEALDLGESYEAVCFVDDSPATAEHVGLPVFHGKNLNRLIASGISAVATEIASSEARLKIRDQLDALGITIVTVIHPTAYVSDSASLGRGCFVKAGAIVDTNSRMGEMCIVDNGVIVAHDNNIGDAVHLAPGVATGGSVTIGGRSIIGIGSSVATGTRIGENCIVSVGTSVTRDVPDNSVVEGVPGKLIGSRKH